uniref:Uncharacterized protein n=1 Tax=Oryza glumipatula TaxID=40148 RepID=A0A0D9YTL9_9ORYZ
MRISIILLPHSIGQCARLDRTASARRHHHQHQVLWWGQCTPLTQQCIQQEDNIWVASSSSDALPTGT